jgi:hypothetical protein
VRFRALSLPSGRLVTRVFVVQICVAGAIALGDICRAVGPTVLRYSDLYVAAAVENLGVRFVSLVACSSY